MSDYYFFIGLYVAFVLLTMYVDALVSIGSRKKFIFVNSFFVSLLFPVTIPFLLSVAQNMTKENDDA